MTLKLPKTEQDPASKNNVFNNNQITSPQSTPPIILILCLLAWHNSIQFPIQITEDIQIPIRTCFDVSYSSKT